MTTMIYSIRVEDTGLHINTSYPYLGASPDGLVTCICCGDELLEIKMPYGVLHMAPTNVSYLRTSMNAENGLSQSHEHYYQTQGQIGITDQLIVTSSVGHQKASLWNNRVQPSLLWDGGQDAMVLCVGDNFPILYGTSTVDTHPSEASGVLCYCQKGKVGDMLHCDSPSCQYGWLCVTLSSVPTGAWSCPDCRQWITSTLYWYMV